MVLTATETISHLSAASTAASIHLYYEGEVVETPLRSFTDQPALDGVAVLAPEQGIVEFFPSDDQSLFEISPGVTAALDDGWRVGVIVPTYRMGEAHRALRGQELHLQGWWAENDRICFGGPEVP